MPYLNINEVESALSIATSGLFSPFTQLITLPNLTWEGRQCHAIKIGNGSSPGRPGVFFLGGVHAREWGSADILVYFVERLDQAYQAGTGLTFGTRNFSASDIQTIVNTLDIVIFPQANPDGRNESMTGDSMWRKNRRVIAPNSTACPGVDVNRNFDFLWNFPTYFSSVSAIAVSTDPCDYQTYHGPSAFSEPESRNAKWIFDNFPNIRFFIDVHSYGKNILYSWGDDEGQSADPSLNFRNPAYNGQRGVKGDVYKEYIPAADLSMAVDLANTIRSAIQAVRGTTYDVNSSFSGLYPTAGTSDDYAYSRHFVDPTKENLISYTVEWGTEFQPPYSEMQNIMQEITCGLLAFCLNITEKTMAWELTGNSGTNPATNFLGTTDNQPLAIKTNGSERLRIASDGNVGIGTTQPSARLYVVAPGASEMTGLARSATLLTSAGSLGTVDGAELALATIGFGSSGPVSGGSSSSLGIRARRVANGSGWDSTAIGLGMDVDDTVRAGASLWLNAYGNIGIGTFNPTNKLEIKTNAQYTGLLVSNDTGPVAVLCGSTPTNDEGGLHLYSAGAKTVQLMSKGGSFFNGGNIGIGTNTPANKLHLHGNTANLALTFTNAANTPGKRGYRIAFDNDRLTFQRANDSGLFIANHLAIMQDTGNVGIGTTNPTNKLEIKTNAQYTGLLVSNDTGPVAVLCGSTPTNDEGGLHLYSAGAKTVQLMSKGGSFFNGGNIGIGTAPTNARLEVVTTSPSDSALVARSSGGGFALVAIHSAGGTAIGASSGTPGSINPAVIGSNLGNGAGVLGLATLTSLTSFGVFGVVGPSLTTVAIPVTNTGGIGVVGSSPTGVGVGGITVGVTNHNHGVEGFQGSANGLGAGVFGHTDSASAVGVQGQNTAVNGLAGRFIGNVGIFGTVGASGKQFRIDHPLDPANKYLSHSSIESPDMMNVYNGNITTDIDRSAVVVLPDYFESLNRDFKYQLTVIGEFAQAVVEREIEDNRFAIRTDRPNVKISWQVTGVRRDPYAEAHRILVEEEKSDTERGRYLHPELYETTSTEPDARLPIGWIASMLSGESVDLPVETDALIG